MVVSPRRRAVRAMRQTISPRLATSIRRIIGSHPEHAEAGGSGFLGARQRECQSQNSAGVERVDDAVIPQPRRGVVRVSLPLELLSNGRLEFFFVGIAESFPAPLQRFALYLFQTAARLLAPH